MYRYGRLLTLSDITTDKDTMLKEAEDYIRTQLELPRYQKVLPDSQEDITSAIKEQILTDETWYFTNGGISFVSNTDVLAPHAAGPLFFTVPYQQFGTLKPEYQYTGPLELSAPVGSTISANLDGNEDMDAIFYDCVDNEETGSFPAHLPSMEQIFPPICLTTTATSHRERMDSTWNTMLWIWIPRMNFQKLLF